jgi:hypothetical protein
MRPVRDGLNQRNVMCAACDGLGCMKNLDGISFPYPISLRQNPKSLGYRQWRIFIEYDLHAAWR